LAGVAGERVAGWVAGAAVAVTVFDSTGAEAGSASTDGSGVYSVWGLPAGSYTVEFSDDVDGYLPQFYNGQSSIATANPVTVSLGQTTSGVDAALTTGGRVSGAVTDAVTGQAIAGAQVTVLDANGSQVGAASTDQSGT